jgi:hypothetical protein
LLGGAGCERGKRTAPPDAPCVEVLRADRAPCRNSIESHSWSGVVRNQPFDCLTSSIAWGKGRVVAECMVNVRVWSTVRLLDKLNSQPAALGCMVVPVRQRNARAAGGAIGPHAWPGFNRSTRREHQQQGGVQTKALSTARRPNVFGGCVPQHPCAAALTQLPHIQRTNHSTSTSTSTAGTSNGGGGGIG